MRLSASNTSSTRVCHLSDGVTSSPTSRSPRSASGNTITLNFCSLPVENGQSDSLPTPVLSFGEWLPLAVVKVERFTTEYARKICARHFPAPDSCWLRGSGWVLSARLRVFQVTALFSRAGRSTVTDAFDGLRPTRTIGQREQHHGSDETADTGHPAHHPCARR
jgi:hypothetical protein